MDRFPPCVLPGLAMRARGFLGGRVLQGKRLRLVAFLALLCFAAEGCASEGRATRYALVIGNQAYSYRPVPSARNDARKMEDAFTDLGFKVQRLENASRDQMRTAMSEFLGRLQDGDVALFYFSGHGVQYGGENFLVPVDAVVRKVEDIRDQAVALTSLFPNNARQGPNKPRQGPTIVLLDACRAPPFPAPVIQAIVPGLTDTIAAPPDTVIGFATTPGEIAELGGSETHSPYTQALLRHLGTPGVRFADTLMRVRITVEANTSGRQTPWENGSARAHFFFRPAATATFQIDHADDELLVLVNGAIVTSFLKYGREARTVELAAGANPFTLLVYNERTFSGGVEILGGHKPLGWDFQLSVSTDRGLQRTFSGREDIPEKDGPRHGKLFEVVTGMLYVNEQTGQVSLEDLGERKWEH